MYIGSHKGQPDDGYIASGKLFLEYYHRDPDDFTREILAQGEYTEMRDIERRLQLEVDAARNPMYFNQSNSSKTFYLKEHTAEAKKKIADLQRGRTASPEAREKMSRSRTGKKRSAEAIAKTAEAHRGRKRPKETGEKISARLRGKKASDEAKAKMSNVRKGKPRPEGFAEKVSKALKGRPFSEDHKQKLRGPRPWIAGDANPFAGKKHSEETRQKMKEAWERRRVQKSTENA